LKLGAATFSAIMPGHSRPKDGVASLAYDPGIHRPSKTMDGRIKPAMTARRSALLRRNTHRST
jgi:hypothetical protein